MSTQELLIWHLIAQLEPLSRNAFETCLNESPSGLLSGGYFTSPWARSSVLIGTFQVERACFLRSVRKVAGNVKAGDVKQQPKGCQKGLQSGHVSGTSPDSALSRAIRCQISNSWVDKGTNQGRHFYGTLRDPQRYLGYVLGTSFCQLGPLRYLWSVQSYIP